MKRLKLFRDFIVGKILLFFSRLLRRKSPRPSSVPHSLILEISLLYTIILGIILVVFSAVLYMMLSFTLFRELDFELKLKAQEISQSIQSYVKIYGQTEDIFNTAVEKTIVQEASSLKKWWIFGAERRWLKLRTQMDIEKDYINFLTSRELSVAQSKNLLEEPELGPYFLRAARTAYGNRPNFYDLKFKDRKIRVINYPFVSPLIELPSSKQNSETLAGIIDASESFRVGKEKLNNQRYILQVGVSPQPISLLLQNWLHYIVVSIPVVLVLASFAGGVLALRILQPVEEITNTARNISEQDLSARVQSQHYYKEMNKLTDAFNDMIARLEKSFKHIGEFSSHVAHELKTPLTIIKGEIEVSLMEERREEEYRRVMNIALEEVDRMLRTIDDLLLLARLDYQPGSFHFGEFDFVGFMREVYSQSKVLARKRKIQVKAQWPAERLLVKGDQLHLRRLFFNLIDNAIKFTPSGGEIEIQVTGDKGAVRCAVRDTGVGIAAENLEKIFERFFYANSFPGGSMGLGLSMAKAIAKIHQGDIKVESALNRGSTFTVTLPMEKIEWREKIGK